MSVNKLILFAIVAAFVAFGHIRMATAYEVTAEELRGKWYTIALISNITNIRKHECMRATITRSADDHINNIVSTEVVEGKQRILKGTATVYDTYLDIENESYNTRYIIKPFQKIGQEIIFYRQAETPTEFELISHHHIASDEIMEQLKKISANVGLAIILINQKHCPEIN